LYSESDIKGLPLRYKLFFIMILTFSLALPVFFLSQSNDLYVSPSGNDSTNCSFLTPCQTFWQAENLAQPGDVIHLLEGNYNEVYDAYKSGNANAPIIITGNNAVVKSLLISGDYIIVKNIEVTGAEYHGIITKGSHIVIQDTVVHHNVTDNGYGPICNTQNNIDGGWGSGIKVERGSENIIIKNNLVYENCGEGIAATMGEYVSIIDNISRDNFSVNIYVDNSSFTTVLRNKVICTGEGYLRDGRRATGIAIGEEVYEGWGAQRHDNHILENTVDGCYEGISSWKSKVPEGIEKNLDIKDNIVTNETYQSISLYWVNQNVKIEGNTVDTPIFIENQGGTVLSNNIVKESEN
jgi:hypothetical protein